MNSHSAADARPNQLQQKSPTGSLPPAVPLAITRTFRPWTHTSDDRYIYQLSLVVATATVSLGLGTGSPGSLNQYILYWLRQQSVDWIASAYWSSEPEVVEGCRRRHIDKATL